MYGFLERFFIGATPAWRVLLAAFISTPCFLLIMGLFGLGLIEPEVRKVVHKGPLLASVAAMGAAAVVNVALIAKLWPSRRQAGPQPMATLLIVQAIGLGFTAMAIPIGVFTTGASVVLMGVLAVGVWLFDQRPMLLGYFTVNLLILLNDAGVLLAWWPYAPALTPASYTEGPAQWWFLLLRELLFLFGWASLIVLLSLLIGSLEAITDRLSRLSNTDGLTGLANRRAFMEMLGTEIERQARTGQPLCVVLIDADHFKRVNDEHGHAEGDEVLLTLAQLLSSCVRSPTDLASRLGGEEFALILPDTRREHAAAICSRLRHMLAEHEFGTKNGRFKVTVSIGLVESFGLPLATLLQRADEQLYKAKAMGRDRVCVLETEGASA